jgi:hypothetical protein
LLVIDNPELIAELHEAEAATLVADAELQRINLGTRAEIVAQRKAEIDRATADLTLARPPISRSHNRPIAAPSSSPPTNSRPSPSRPGHGHADSRAEAAG